MSEQGRRFITVRAGRSGETEAQELWVAALVRGGRRVLMIRLDGQTEILPFTRPTR